MVHLGKGAPTATYSHTFSLSIFSAASAPSSEAEGLYQLGVPRCPPQSSIEGLEDVEVGFLFYCFYSQTARGVHKCPVLYLYPNSTYAVSAVCPC